MTTATEYIESSLRIAIANLAHFHDTFPRPEQRAQAETHGDMEQVYAVNLMQLHGYLAEASVAHMLIRVQANSPELADELADELTRYNDAGDVWGELSWQYAEERGLDPEQLETDARTQRAEWLARPIERPTL